MKDVDVVRIFKRALEMLQQDLIFYIEKYDLPPHNNGRALEVAEDAISVCDDLLQKANYTE